MMIHRAFVEVIRLLGGSVEARLSLWNDVQARYSERSRYYHNLDHVDTLIRQLWQASHDIKDWPVIVLAVAYHDIIYDPQRDDNEAASAGHAGKKLAGIVAPDRLQHVLDMILATKSHGASADRDTNYLTDADLAILGAEPAAYLKYTEQIRLEYRSYADEVYEPGRLKMLKHFLEMRKIYKTGHFYERYEKQARKNLEAEMKRLAG